MSNVPDQRIKYEIDKIQFRYGYTSAYNEPKKAWLVPVWVISCRESYWKGEEKILEYPNVNIMFSALDGGFIVPVNYMSIQ